MDNKVVIVHGIQTGDNENAIKGPQKMSRALERYIDARAEFTTTFPAYEHINEEAQETFRTISDLILRALRSPVRGIFDKLVDLVGDVFVYADDTGGESIRSHVRQVIEDNPNCILVGHSLGSVICFDIISEMMKQDQFKNKARDLWPIRSLITFGSPLALDMFKNSRELISHDGTNPFHWYNYSDRNDPVISGRIFGSSFEQNHLMRDTYVGSDDLYRIHDRQVETGFHLLAHIHYWQQKHIIMRIGQQFT